MSNARLNGTQHHVLVRDRADTSVSYDGDPRRTARDALEGGGGGTPPRPRAPSLCPATVPLTASAGFIGICNRQ